MTLEAIEDRVSPLSRCGQGARTADATALPFPPPPDRDPAPDPEAIVSPVDSGKIKNVDGPEFFARQREGATA